MSLPVIFARFYGNLRIIQLGPGDHFPRYANSTVRPATRRTVLTMVVAGGRREGEEARGMVQGNSMYKSKMKRETEKRNERSCLYRPQFKNLISNDRSE